MSTAPAAADPRYPVGPFQLPTSFSDAERRETATVLAAGQGTVLRFADRIETGVPGRLAFDSVPENLRDRPTLSVLLEAAGGRQASISAAAQPRKNSG